MQQPKQVVILRATYFEIIILQDEFDSVQFVSGYFETGNMELFNIFPKSCFKVREDLFTNPYCKMLHHTGYVAGKKHNINGGGSNFLCLTKQPEYTNLQSPNIAKNLYGVETDINGFSPSIADKDMTCAVCLTQRSSVLMIPGTKSCPSGWNMEYWGYLMSHGVGGTWQPTKYICTDSRPVAVPGGDRDNGESVVYLVGGVCGSLKCPPYINGKPLTCVVCSR
ncbi:unnamed protein product [Mytilus coruscus]|uniref:Short-chain collagen C4-like n=1 Tax=Mytilus coruscus TaxID=42192 RepID=A0A6J8BL01_MYTCO|nr:unnamed protein product [Mytilus coruscus]